MIVLFALCVSAEWQGSSGSQERVPAACGWPPDTAQPRGCAALYTASPPPPASLLQTAARASAQPARCGSLVLMSWGLYLVVCGMWDVAVSCVDVVGSLPCCLWNVGCGSLVLMSWGLYLVVCGHVGCGSLVLMSWGLYTCCLWDVGCGSLVLMSWGLYLVVCGMWDVGLLC